MLDQDILVTDTPLVNISANVAIEMPVFMYCNYQLQQHIWHVSTRHRLILTRHVSDCDVNSFNVQPGAI